MTDDIKTPPVNSTAGTIAPVSEPVPFELLPEAIQLHLNTKETIASIIEIEKRFSIPDSKVRAIPFIIGALVEGEIDPRDTVEAIKAALTISTEQAKEIAATIKEKILAPIAGGLLIVSGIDIELIPGKSVLEAKDAPGLAEEMAPYLTQQPQPTPGPSAAKKDTALEPLVVAPAPQRKVQPGMSLPPTRQPLRPMNDVVARPSEPKPEIKPEPVKLTAAPRPFMLHEEKPVAPQEQKAFRVDERFSFTPSPTQPTRTPAKPVTAKLGASFEEMLAPQKPANAPVSKTDESPKVVHYTAMKTMLSDEKPKG